MKRNIPRRLLRPRKTSSLAWVKVELPVALPRHSLGRRTERRSVARLVLTKKNWQYDQHKGQPDKQREKDCMAGLVL